MDEDTVGYCVDLTEKKCGDILLALQKALDLMRSDRGCKKYQKTMEDLIWDYSGVYEAFD